MEERFAIQDVLSTYSHSVGLRNFDRTLSTFAEDGVWELKGAGVRCQGHTEILATLHKFIDPFESFLQLNTPAIIVVEGDTATANWSVRECGRFAGETVTRDIIGTYADQLVKTADGWKFAHHCFTPIALWEHVGVVK